MLRIWNALKNSFSGVRDAIFAEKAFRQEVILACFLIPLALILPVSSIVKLILIISHISALFTELLNSAIEKVVDIVSPTIHPLAKRAKDYGSAAVMLSLISLSIVWIYVLIQLFVRAV